MLLFRLAAFVTLTAACLAGDVARANAADPVVAAVGDLACAPNEAGYNAGNGTASRCRQRYVSDLVGGTDALLALGDNQYLHGELAHYRAVYQPTFGRFDGIVYPSLGNAEYDTPGAQGYFDYFAGAGVAQRIALTAGDASNWAHGYYSFDLGAWHIIALNSNCAQVGGCAAGSPQETWLRTDLAAHAHRCTLAFWHHPRWNTGLLGDDASTAAFWTALYEANADVVLNGHGNHHYERFKPQNPSGAPDPNGIRQFIVSTGGETHGTPPATPRPSTTREVTDYTSFGLLRLTLSPGGYAWNFVPEVGGHFTDSGSTPCHAAMSPPPPPPPPGHDAAPVVKLLNAKGRRLRTLLKRGWKLRARCSEACTMTLTMTPRGRTRVLARAVGRTTKAGTTTLFVKLTSAGRRALKGKRSMWLRHFVVASDAAGQRSTVNLVVRARR